MDPVSEAVRYGVCSMGLLSAVFGVSPRCYQIRRHPVGGRTIDPVKTLDDLLVYMDSLPF